MDWRDLGFYARARLGRGSAGSSMAPRSAEAGRATRRGAARRRDAAGAHSVLEGRSNPEREAAVARWLLARGIPFTRDRFETFEGRGENFCVEVGRGDGRSC